MRIDFMDATQKQITIYRRMTPNQRWQEALRLYAFARELKAAALRSFHPEWNEATVQKEVRKAFLYAHT